MVLKVGVEQTNLYHYHTDIRAGNQVAFEGIWLLNLGIPFHAYWPGVAPGLWKSLRKLCYHEQVTEI